MSIDWPIGYKHGYLWFHNHPEHAHEFEGKLLQANVVHELVHLLLCDLADFGDEVGGEESIMGRLFSRALELGVDTVTSVVLNFADALESDVGVPSDTTDA